MTIDAPCRSAFASRQLLVQATFRVAAASRGRQAAQAAEEYRRGQAKCRRHECRPRVALNNENRTTQAVAGTDRAVFLPPLARFHQHIPHVTGATLAALRLRLPSAVILRRFRGLTVGAESQQR